MTTSQANRPYIICHMETSLDGKIIGPFMNTPQAAAASRHYNETHLTFDSQAWLCGRVTLEAFTGGQAPYISPDLPRVAREDHLADPEARDFVVAADPSGTLGWRSNTLTYSVRPAGHIIELLTDRASDDYVAYLHANRISYVFAGTDRLDLAVASTKLRALFGITTLVVSGGAVINGSFLNAGLVDEVSLVVSAVVDDHGGTPGVFERATALPLRGTTAFRLASSTVLSDDVLWTRYVTRRPAA